MARKTGIPSLIKHLKQILRLLAKFYNILVALFPDDPDLQNLVNEQQASSTNLLTWLENHRDVGD